MAYNTLSKVLPENKNYTENPLISPIKESKSFNLGEVGKIGNVLRFWYEPQCFKI